MEFYKHWMKYLKDDKKLTEIIIPSAHNAGSYGMGWQACCQDGDLYEQFCYGIRHFCIRLCTDRKGNILMCHGPTKGEPFEDALKSLKRAMDESDDFFILDVREYYPEKILFFHFTFEAEKSKVDALLAKYLLPEKYAMTDFSHVGDITMGDIRKSGKRYLLVNYQGEYEGSVDCPHIIPWEKDVNGAHAHNFVKKTLRFFDDYRTEGLYWFQTQQTPNLGTEIGFRSPRKLDKKLRPYFKELTDGIAENPFYLQSANIISGDFMTEDHMKVNRILKLNVLKHTVRDEDVADYLAGMVPDDE